MIPNNTILVISNNTEEFVFATSRLRHAGYRVRFERDPDASLRIAHTECPRLIVSELAVPDIDGLKLCFDIRNCEGLGSTPILLVGDLSKESSIVSDGLRYGATDYLQKPFDQVRLFEVCRELASLDGLSVRAALGETSAGRFPLSSAMANDMLRHAIFDSSTMALATFSSSGHFLEGNPALLAKLSNSQCELTDMSLSDLIFPSNDHLGRQAIGEILSGKRLSYEFDNGYLDPTGKRVWGRVALVRCSGNEGEAGFIMGVFSEPDGFETLEEPKHIDRAGSTPLPMSAVMKFSDWRVNSGLLSEN